MKGTLYLYRCESCGLVERRHPMSEVGLAHYCDCGAVLKRVLTPIKHRWPAQYRPGFEESGQRMMLDPEFQAREKDTLVRRKQEHLDREVHHDPQHE